MTKLPGGLEFVASKETAGAIAGMEADDKFAGVIQTRE
jgi:hypothetical protein